jgi:hypothetical protein
MQKVSTKAARYPFTAERDENGVPHIHAASWLEAIYAWGYMHATDRPTQVYFARAVASGPTNQNCWRRTSSSAVPHSTAISILSSDGCPKERENNSIGTARA